MRLIKILYCVLAIALLSASSLSLGIGTMQKEINYYADEVSSIKYYVVKDTGKNMTACLKMQGNLSDFAAFRFDNFWYSTRLDKTNNFLVREVDLRNVSSATLSFRTRFNIEYGWDFGYIEVSLNNGTTWSQLSAGGMTTYRDPSAYVGVPGAPAYTGSLPGWTSDSADLSAYVGSRILLRFRYVTDEYYAEYGWQVDDIGIPEINYSDSSHMGWSTNGWADNCLELGASTSAYPFFIDLDIPSDFSSNSTERLMVYQIPGAIGDFNPSWSSAAIVIADLPPLNRLYRPASVPSTGGGGGSQAPDYYSYSADGLVYSNPLLAPFRDYMIESARSGTLVERITISVVERSSDVRFSILQAGSIPAPLKDALGYFRIETSLEDSSIREAVIRVKVPRSYADRYDKRLVVSRLKEGSWTDLPTRFAEQQGDYYFYEATTPGFSYFSVRPMPDVPKPLPTNKPKLSDVKQVLVITANNTSTIKEFQDILIAKSNATPQEIEELVGKTEKPDTRPPILGVLVLALFATALALFALKRAYLARKKKTADTIDNSSTKRKQG